MKARAQLATAPISVMSPLRSGMARARIAAVSEGQEGVGEGERRLYRELDYILSRVPFTCQANKDSSEDYLSQPVCWTMQSWPVVHEPVDAVLQTNCLEEGYLQEVHGNIELEHVRGEDDISIVELHNDEDTVRERGSVEWARNSVCILERD